jgi:hypothetical protein
MNTLAGAMAGKLAMNLEDLETGLRAVVIYHMSRRWRRAPS